MKNMAGVFINLFIFLIQSLTSIFLKIIKYLFIEKKLLSRNNFLQPSYLFIAGSIVSRNIKRLISPLLNSLNRRRKFLPKPKEKFKVIKELRLK